MHEGELWQEYEANGQAVVGSGHPKEYFEHDGSTAHCGAVQVWLYREGAKGKELLFQKRSATVSHNPGKWDVSAAGHINLGETTLEAAIRETREEIGADIDPARLILVGSNLAIIHRILCVTYLYKWSGSDDFHFDDDEVSAVRWVPIDEVPEFVRQNAKTFLAELNWYWELLIDHHLNLL